MLLKNNIKKVLKNFFLNPRRKFQLREIARLSKVSTTAAKNALERMIKEGLIKRSKERIYFVYSAEADSEKFKAEKKSYTVECLKESGVLEFLDENLHRPEAIVLFGSASRGEDEEKSDIDLFALVSEKHEVDLSKSEVAIGKRISLLQMTKKEFETAKEKSPELVNNIANGTVIKGYLKVI